MSRFARLMTITILLWCASTDASGQLTSDHENNIAQVTALINLLGSESYQERDAAHSELVGMGKPLLELLRQIDQPESIEARYRLGRIKRDLSAGRFTKRFWTLKCEPFDGETLDIKRIKTVRFFASGSFQQFDPSSPDGRSQASRRRHAWQLIDGGAGIRLDFNNGYAIYSGKFISSTKARGTAKNIKGQKWKFELTRFNDNDVQRYFRTR